MLRATRAESASDASPPGRAGDRGSIDTPARWPLLFVAASLLALTVAPVFLGNRITSQAEGISEVLDPARDQSAELALLLARKMSRFEAYLLTGQANDRQRYRALHARQDTVYQELVRRVGLTGMPGLSSHERVRAQMAVLHSVVTNWEVNHLYALQGDQQRRDYLEDIQGEQGRYEEVLTASQGLTAALAGQIDEARAEMERAREIQISITVLLAAMAFLATGAVAGIGQRLRGLVGEAERRREEALRARREMEALLEATGDGVLGVDLQGRCTTLNETGSRLLGYSEVEALDRDVHELIHGRAPEGRSHRPDACPVLLAMRSGTVEHETDDLLWRRDGVPFHARWYLRPLRDGLEVRGGVLTITDMTAVHEAETALRQAVQARDQVVAVVSHDLRNPLGTISAASDLILELELPEATKEEQLRIIRRTTDRMNRLIQDLLDVSRIEGGGLSVEVAPIDVDSLVGEAVELQAPQARERGITLRTTVERGLPRVMADHHRILQVFSNLLGNALKHTPPGGRITVEGRTRDGEVLLSVSDTGEGIEREALDHLFDRFWQARSGDRSGAGLGLAIVKGIVDAHGGRVWAESEPGVGSVFTFALPAHPRRRGEEREPSPAGGASARVWTPGAAQERPTGSEPPDA